MTARDHDVARRIAGLVKFLSRAQREAKASLLIEVPRRKPLKVLLRRATKNRAK